MSGDLQRRVEILYTATDAGASATANQVANNITNVDKSAAATTKSTGVLSTSMKALAGALAGVVSVSKGLQFAEQSVAAFHKQDQANRLVTTSFGAAAAGITEFASALQVSAGEADEATLMYAGMLKTMGLTEQQIRDTITASADLSAGSGGMITMESAVRNLAKTYSGLAGELGESVPALRELTAEQLKAGQGVAVIAKQYKGLAEELHNSPTGEVRALKNEIGDLQEEIGAKLLPVQADWLKAQKSIVSTINDLSPALSAAAKGVSVLVGAFSAVADNKVALGLTAAAGGMWALNSAVTAGTISWTSFNAAVAANPLGLVAVSVAGVIAALDQLGKKQDEILGKQQDVFLGSAESIQKNIDALNSLTEANRRAISPSKLKALHDEEKALEKATGMTVQYNEATGQAELKNKHSVVTIRTLTGSLLAKSQASEKAAKAETESANATMAATKRAAEAAEAAAKAKERQAEADRKAAAAAAERARAEEAAAAEVRAIRLENYLNTKSERDRELAELVLSTNARRQVLIDGEQATAENLAALAEAQRTRALAIDTKYQEQAKANAEREADRKRTEAEKEQAEKDRNDALTLQKEQELSDRRIDIASTTANAIMSVLDAVNNRRQQDLNREVAQEKAAVNASTMSQEEKAKKLAAIDKAAANEKYKLDTAAWRNSFLGSIANTALAVTKTLASVPFPASVPLAAAAGAAGLVQTGIVAANKPQKLAEGGVLAGGSTVSDSVTYQGNPGERVISKQRTRKLDQAIDSGALGGNSTTYISMPVTIPENAPPTVADTIREAANYTVDQLVRALEVAAEQGKIDKSRFVGVFV